MNEELIRRIEYLEEVVNHLIKSDVFVFSKRLQLMDGRNVVVGKGTGTKIGTETTQKIGFWNKTPIVQPASANQAALSLDLDVNGGNTVDEAAIEGNFTAIQTLVNQLRADLVSAGLIKGEA